GGLPGDLGACLAGFAASRPEANSRRLLGRCLRSREAITGISLFAARASSISPGRFRRRGLWPRTRLFMRRAECELALVEAEVLGGVAVDVRQGHVFGEERVPGCGVVHAAAQGRVGFVLQVPAER